MCLFPRETSQVAACRYLAIPPRVKSPTSWDFGLVVEKEKMNVENKIATFHLMQTRFYSRI